MYFLKCSYGYSVRALKLLYSAPNTYYYYYYYYFIKTTPRREEEKLEML